MKTSTQITTNKNHIRPLKVGAKSFPANIIQAPLAGISSAPFRLLTWQLSHPAFTCTEMIAAKALLLGQIERQRCYITKLPGEGPVSFQLVGSEPEAMGEATKMLSNEYGADLIDLNCGCSVRKVRRKNEGSKLLEDPALLYKLITAIKNNTHLPVTIKIRVDGNSKDNLNDEIVKVVKDSGIDLLTVHGRNWREKYDTPCHYDDIQYFVENLDIPVIGNGDVADLETLQKMFATGCAGVMIGRAGIGKPWLIGELMAQMRGVSFTPPTPEKIGQIFWQQVNTMAQFFGREKTAVLKARLLGHCYSRGLKHRKEIAIKVNSCKNLADIEKLVKEFFVRD